MSFDPKDLEALASALVSAGAPIIGGMLGGPVGAAVAPAIVETVAKTLGLPADAPPQTITQTIATDPSAPDKLAALDAQNKADQAYYDSQIAANQALAVIGGNFWEKFFVVGARPAGSWLAGPLVILYQIAAYLGHFTPIPTDIYWTNLGLYGAIIGIRSFEKTRGVATNLIRK